MSAPTSSGKTVVADYVIWRRLDAPAALRRPITDAADVVYTTPLKALSNQKYHDLCERFGEHRIGLITGEHTLNDGAPVLVMTTEILRNVLYDEPARVDRVGDVVLDEVHYINDYPRGTVWEELIIEAPHHIRLIGLSATISNVGEVAAWMSGLRGTIETVTRTERPVALEMWLAIDNALHPLFDKAGNAARGTLELAQADAVQQPRFREARRAPDNDMLQVIDVLHRRSMLPAIYFIFSRRGCREALQRCGVHGIDLTNDDEKERIDIEITERMAALSDEDERQCVLLELDRRLLRRGLAMHHAGLLPYAKETVERLFQQGLIKVVFATETLSLGLNMPARSCVISTFTKFDGVSFASLTSGELTQLMGRAGRRGIDTVGQRNLQELGQRLLQGPGGEQRLQRSVRRPVARRQSLQSCASVHIQRAAVRRADDLQILGGELDIHEPAGGELEVPQAGGRALLVHQRPHLPDVGGGPGGVSGTTQGGLDGALRMVGEGGRRGPHHPRTGQGQELPSLRLAAIITLERRQADGYWALGAGGSKLKVDLVETALRCRRR